MNLTFGKTLREKEITNPDVLLVWPWYFILEGTTANDLIMSNNFKDGERELCLIIRYYCLALSGHIGLSMLSTRFYFYVSDDAKVMLE